MRGIEASPTTGSPLRTVYSPRNNNRYTSDGALSPRMTSFTPRNRINRKILNAQLHGRKTSNPISKSRNAEPNEDDWQDVDFSSKKKDTDQYKEPTMTPMTTMPQLKFPDLKPPTDSPIQPETPSQHSQSRNEPETPNNQSHTSFMGFSSANLSSSILSKLSDTSDRLFKRKHNDTESEYSENTATSDASPSYASSFSTPPRKPKQRKTTKQHSKKSDKPFWSDLQTPGLLAMYLQVGYNAVMVLLVLYAILMFYVTIRNDVNMKVEEYAADIVNEIEHCSFEFLRNGCEPSKRVPAIEAACRAWEKCMQQDPQVVGRGKVSAETFGEIIESFLKPIGLKSMIFIISMFAGSFLLVNSIFASRIGPRFSREYHNDNDLKPTPQPTPSGYRAHPIPDSSMAFQVQQSPVPNQSPMAHSAALPYPQGNSFMFTPQQMNSPRNPRFQANLQSSPIHPQQYINFPY